MMMTITSRVIFAAGSNLPLRVYLSFFLYFFLSRATSALARLSLRSWPCSPWLIEASKSR